MSERDWVMQEEVRRWNEETRFLKKKEIEKQLASWLPTPDPSTDVRPLKAELAQVEAEYQKKSGEIAYLQATNRKLADQIRVLKHEIKSLES
jgi:septal ring factor EnvC (AmiA/AmiB activator)